MGAILILIAGWIVAGWSSKRVYKLANASEKIDKTLPPIFRKIVKISIMIITFLAVLGNFGVETTSIIAVLGAATLAIGLALQGTLSNVASGVMLLIFRPFSVDDFINVGTISGTVTEIGIFTTTFKTPDGLAIIAPNSKVWGNEITNYSTNDIRRLDLPFGIGYSDDMDKAIEVVSTLITNDGRVLKDPELMVVVNELADSSVNLLARPWCHRSDYWQLKWDMTKRIKEVLDENNISIPFPQRDVHLFQENQKN
ncbi:MAG TPA: mechanosensitive ion channel protein MscS [Bacteroidetes bacterium]|nr:mechanosensitive ion channel protein MscS [Bacteroidota bacterium]